MSTVLICHNPMVGHVVLRALAHDGVRPWLIYDEVMAASLHGSRLIRGVLFSARDLSQHTEQIIAAINRQGVKVAIGADVEAQLLLHCMPPTIRSFPMTDETTLLLLNDKRRFAVLAERLGLRIPFAFCFDDKTQIDVGQVRGAVGFPLVVKPTGRWGGMGFRNVRDVAGLQKLIDDPAYQFGEIQVQRFIPGTDIGIGLYATAGRVHAAATFLVHGGIGTVFRPIPEMLDMAKRLIEATHYTGVANFDGRIDADGRVWLFECNPRFFMRLGALQAAGVDLLRLGLDKLGVFGSTSVPGRRTPVTVPSGGYFASKDLLTMRGWQRLATGEWPLRRMANVLWQTARDPIPLLSQRFGRGAIKQPW